MRYSVNPDELRKLAGGLADVVDRLGPAHMTDRPSAAALGSTAVAQALEQVSDNWSRARRRLTADVEHLARAVEEASASYAAVEGSPFAAPTSAGVGR